MLYPDYGHIFKDHIFANSNHNFTYKYKYVKKNTYKLLIYKTRFYNLFACLFQTKRD